MKPARQKRARLKHGADAGQILNGPDGAKTVRVPPKWRWHYDKLVQLRERLLAERREHLVTAAAALEPHSLDIADSATDEFDHDIALSQLSAGGDALFEIEAALNRIENGAYGFCEESGRPIAAERLKAIPWTRFCTEVEARLEKNVMLPRPALGALHSVRERKHAELPESVEEMETKEAAFERPKAMIEKAVSEPPRPREREESEGEE